MMAISFERYQTVANPFQRNKQATLKRALVTLTFVWGVIVLDAVMATVFFYDTIMFQFCVNQVILH